MKKQSILYICKNRKSALFECSSWYKSFKSALSEGVKVEQSKIVTPYAIIDFVHRKPLFIRKKYDYIFNAAKQGDDAWVFALGIGTDY